VKNKKEEILEAALKLFIEYGIHATPTSKIAKEAGVANGTLFHYYTTKNDLIVALYSKINDNLSSFIYATIIESDSLQAMLRKVFLRSIEWSQANRNEQLFMKQFNTVPFIALLSTNDINLQPEEILPGLFQKGVDDKILKPLPADLLYQLFTSQVAGINQYLLTSELSDKQRAQLAEESFAIVWTMLI
jgi:AcrR family transcriptional regulator